jgi:hypothetical protein
MHAQGRRISFLRTAQYSTILVLCKSRDTRCLRNGCGQVTIADAFNAQAAEDDLNVLCC